MTTPSLEVPRRLIFRGSSAHSTRERRTGFLVPVILWARPIAGTDRSEVVQSVSERVIEAENSLRTVLIHLNLRRIARCELYEATWTAHMASNGGGHG
jgi:hypothetical protein